MIPGVDPTDFYLVETLLREEERQIRDRVRKWGESQLAPIAAECWEKERFPKELLPSFAQLDVIGGTVGDYGCPKLSSVAYGLASQELARCDSSFTTFFGIHSGLVMTAIARYGSEDQKTLWLPKLVSCQAVGAFALTEPNHGSDVVSLETTATRDGDQWVLNGRKRWIGLGDCCDLMIVWARDPDGQVAGFLVEGQPLGLAVTRMAGKLSKRSIPNAELVFEQCRIPEANRMPVGGFRAVTELLTLTRHNLSWAAIGDALACYEVALDHCQNRQQFGKRLASLQLVQEKLVRMLCEITKAQLLSYHLSLAKDAGQMTAGMSAMAKYNNASMAREIAREARELLGGDGILHERSVMRHLADIESVYTFEGTNEMNLLITGREITGFSAFV